MIAFKDRQITEKITNNLFYQNYHPVFNQIKYQKAIATLGEQILAAENIASLSNEAIDLITETLQIEFGCIWQVFSDGVTLNALAKKGFSAKEELLVSKDDWLACLLQGNRAIIYQTHTCSFATNNCINGISLLIPGQEKPLGLIRLYSQQPKEFTSEEINFLQGAVNLLGIAIERKRAEALLQIQTRILQNISAKVDLEKVLTSLCLSLEEHSPGSICSILLFERTTNKLYAGAAPSLPVELAQAFNGLIIGENVGSCGTAAYRGEAVYVSDVATNPLWECCRELVLKHNFRACWSHPFFSQTGELLGTFAISHTISCQPTAHHIKMLNIGTNLASLAVENYQTVQKIQEQSFYDPLTQLPNSKLFTERLQHRLTSNLNPQSAIFLLDVERLQLVNNTLGKDFGDKFLVALARRLDKFFTPLNILSRMEEDEFAVLIDGVEDLSALEKIAENLQQALSYPLKVEQQELFVSVTTGIVYGDGYTDAETLLKDAKIALNYAKTKNRGRYAIFNSLMCTQRCQSELAIDLSQAVEQLQFSGKSQFQLYYQPIMDLQSQNLAGFEALIRWLHPTKGLIFPVDFIPLAENTGLIVHIGKWVLQQASLQWCTWQETLNLPENLTLSVNVSSRQFLQPNFISTVKEAIELAQIAPSCLNLEITESFLLETSPTIVAMLQHLQDLGIRVSIDDFGTGYSALSYLHRFSLNSLKIDRSFINSLQENQQRILQTIIELAHHLGMNAVAEGIETPEQLAKLQSFGCHLGQGYLFAQPLSVEEVENYLSR